MKTLLVKWLRGFIGVFCVGLIGASAWATPPSTLIVIRAFNDTLWQSTCTAGVCTGFTTFPGLFGSQPTVTWDDRSQGWLLFGTASNGTIWKSSFSSTGTFNNDWVQLAGSAAAPPGAASRSGNGFTSTFGTPAFDVTMTTSFAFNTVSNFGSVDSLDSPLGATGWYQCTATAMVSFTRSSTAGDNVVFFGISDTSGALDSSGGKWTSIDLPNGTPTGMTTVPISVTAWYSATAATKNIYTVGLWRGTNPGPVITMRNLAKHCEYFPEAFL